jgi:uncharacterized protein (TIGR02466 family)
VVTPQVRLSPWFAVPFGESRLPDCARLNRELEALFLERQTAEYRNPTPSHTPQQEMFESRFNLFRWTEPCVRELRTFMMDSVAQTVMAASDLKPEEFGRLQIHNHTWFHVTRYAGSFVAHNHPQASWSAVYCVRAGETADGHPSSGTLRFMDPRPGADAYQDRANRYLKDAYALKPRGIRLEEGQVVIFPSFAFHEVTPFYGRDTRITVASNCWFT